MKLLKRINAWRLCRKLSATEKRLEAIEAARDDLTEQVYGLLNTKRRLQYQLTRSR